jgi:hypothetical protein
MTTHHESANPDHHGPRDTAAGAGESDAPTDIARDKNKMIGEAVWQDYLRKTGRKEA